jgi:type I restriction enzyme, R subunit
LIPVSLPRDTTNYLHYFCAPDTTDKDALTTNEPKRIALYQAVTALIRAYANLANEMAEAGYTLAETDTIKTEVEHYTKMRDEVKVASGDYLDMKRYEPAMRHLLDSYIRADESTVVSEFEELGLAELIVQNGLGVLDNLPNGLRQDPTAMAETIENNIRKTIIDENPVNPKYYDQMSELLDALIRERREQAISYQDYLEKVKQLAQKTVQPIGTSVSNYPASLNTAAKRALYDNLKYNEALALRIDAAVCNTKKEGWIGNRFKEREVANAIREAAGCNIEIDQVLDLVKNQREYQ